MLVLMPRTLSWYKVHVPPKLVGWSQCGVSYIVYEYISYIIYYIYLHSACSPKLVGWPQCGVWRWRTGATLHNGASARHSAETSPQPGLAINIVFRDILTRKDWFSPPDAFKSPCFHFNNYLPCIKKLKTGGLLNMLKLQSNLTVLNFTVKLGTNLLWAQSSNTTALTSTRL